MNKLIKSAKVMASIGAMLCIVGCGEKTPAQEACSTFEEVNGIIQKAGFREGVIPKEKIEELRSGKLGTNDVAQAVELARNAKRSLEKLKKYVNVLHEVNEAIDEKFKDEDVAMFVASFVVSPSEGQDKLIKEQEEILKTQKLVDAIRNNNQ